MTKKRATGRPSLLKRHNITLEELEAIYQEEGSYRKTALRLKTTKRTVLKYLTRGGARKRGRPKGYYPSEARKLLEKNPDLLRKRPVDLIRYAQEQGYSTTYMRALIYRKKREVRAEVIRRIRAILQENVAVRDVEGRYIPTRAIKYVWLPKWRWDRPVFVKAVLRDGTKAKLPTMIVPDPKFATNLEYNVSFDVSEHSDFEDQPQERPTSEGDPQRRSHPQ